MPHNTNINRPLKAWDYELQDPAWRRWFDALQEQGVDSLADSAVGALRGMWSMPGETIHNPLQEPTFDPTFQQSAGRYAAPQVDREGKPSGYKVGYKDVYRADKGISPGNLTTGSRALEELLSLGRLPSRRPRRIT